MTVTVGDIMLWAVLPYVAMILCIAGHLWRYRRDQFGWTSRSTQLLERRWLAWGSNLFHFGALGAIGGHVLGIAVPEDLTGALHVSEPAYRALAAGAGSLTGIACLAGLVILAVRRVRFPRLRSTTTATDVVVFVLLFLIIGMGMVETLGVETFGPGYDYRLTVSIWFRGLFIFDLKPALMATAPHLYQAHALTAWALIAIWPFTRLVHAWSVPWQYLGRPYILYRRRYAASRR
jgi:nitrate reductase gamma subunit